MSSDHTPYSIIPDLASKRELGRLQLQGGPSASSNCSIAQRQDGHCARYTGARTYHEQVASTLVFVDTLVEASPCTPEQISPPISVGIRCHLPSFCPCFVTNDAHG